MNFHTISERFPSPIVVLEEWMSLDFLHPISAESLVHGGKETSDQVLKSYFHRRFSSGNFSDNNTREIKD